MMSRHSALALVAAMAAAACAQVPKQSVELSATVGRDLTTVYQAHRQLAEILFTRMRRDVNRFVDGVYAPFQIRNVMNRQRELATSDDPEDRSKALFLALGAAFQPDASPQLQENVLRAMDAMVRKIRSDVESMRKELLDPLNAQETEVLGSIDRAYQQLHYANSIVTGHLASVVEVHETQAELLEAVGVERDLRAVVGESLANASQQIGALVEAAESADDKLGQAQQNADKLRQAVKELEMKLKQSREEG